MIFENDNFDFHVEFSMKFWGRRRQSDRFTHNPDVMNDLGGRIVVGNVTGIVTHDVAAARNSSVHAILKQNKTFNKLLDEAILKKKYSL